MYNKNFRVQNTSGPNIKLRSRSSNQIGKGSKNTFPNQAGSSKKVPYQPSKTQNPPHGFSDNFGSFNSDLNKSNLNSQNGSTQDLTNLNMAGNGVNSWASKLKGNEGMMAQKQQQAQQQTHQNQPFIIDSLSSNDPNMLQSTTATTIISEQSPTKTKRGKRKPKGQAYLNQTGYDPGAVNSANPHVNFLTHNSTLMRNSPNAPNLSVIIPNRSNNFRSDPLSDNPASAPINKNQVGAKSVLMTPSHIFSQQQQKLYNKTTSSQQNSLNDLNSNSFSNIPNLNSVIANPQQQAQSLNNSYQQLNNLGNFSHQNFSLQNVHVKDPPFFGALG